VELTVGRTPRAIYAKGDVGIVVEHGVPRRDGSIARGGPIDEVRVVGVHRVWPRRAGDSEHRLSLSMSSYGWLRKTTAEPLPWRKRREMAMAGR
jgi:hypothetical protein